MLPKSVNLGFGFRIKIERVSPHVLSAMEEVDGTFSYPGPEGYFGTIMLSNQLKGRALKETYLHELNHAIIDMYRVEFNAR